MSNLSRAARFAAMLLLASAAAIPALGQLYREEKGPGLDPTPIVIPAGTAAVPPRAITTRDLLEIRDLHGVSISPDGSRIAYVVGQAVAASNRYRSGLFVVGTKAGSVPVALGDVGRPFWKLNGQWFSEPPLWTPDGRSVTARMDRGSGWQVWRWDPAGGAPSPVTHSARDVQTYRFSPDGAKIVFEVYPEPDPEKRRRYETEGLLYEEDLSPWDLNTPVVEGKLARDLDKTETWIHDLATGAEHAASKEEVDRESMWVRTEKDLDIVQAAWSPDHRRLAFNRYVSDPTQCALSCYPLFVRDADGSNEKLLTPGMYYAEDPRWSADGRTIVFSARASDGRGATLSSVPAAGGPVRALVRTDQHVGDCTWSRDNTSAACAVEDNVTPPRVAFVDVKAGTLRVVADVNPEFAAFGLTPAIRIDWKNDNSMFAYLVKPRGYEPGKRYPVVVVTYRAGTGFLRGGVGDEYPVPVFAARGFAVLVFDCGSDTNAKPGDFETSMRIWEAPLEGLREALRIAGEMGVADLSRVGYTGLSHGSEIGAFAIAHSDLFRAASMSGGGSWDRLTFDFAPAAFKHWFQQWGVMNADGLVDDQRLHRLSATENAERIHTPLLIQAPDNEYVISLPIYAAMKSRRKPVELWIYPGEYHEKILPTHRLAVYDRNVDWNEFWLMNKEDPDPAKAKQYERWRALRSLDEADRKKGNAP